MVKPKLTVSIVIPAYNEAGSIGKCLDSCVAQKQPADEIIVVDNNSTDDTAKIVRDYQRRFPDRHIRLTTETKQGLNPARDKGFMVAKGEIFARIDSDSAILPDWVRQVRKTFAKKTVAAVSGPVAYHDMPGRRAGLKADERIRALVHRMAEGRDHRYLFGSNMALRASAWQIIKDDVDPDPEGKYHEDIDIALCLHKAGLKIVYNPKMIGSMSARRLEDSPRKFYDYVMRFERTFQHHGIKGPTARIPIFVFLSTYFPLKLLRGAYDLENNRLSMSKLLKSLTEEKDESKGSRA
ncbi:MAG TPA: glycosyltransferase family 2 protein [Candidatus Saccharimonadales bacterium]|nr:glycosyltransferase family 2 protein [Candidatus Saccharimonadales bacterium]